MKYKIKSLVYETYVESIEAIAIAVDTIKF